MWTHHFHINTSFHFLHSRPRRALAPVLRRVSRTGNSRRTRLFSLYSLRGGLAQTATSEGSFFGSPLKPGLLCLKSFSGARSASLTSYLARVPPALPTRAGGYILRVPVGFLIVTRASHLVKATPKKFFSQTGAPSRSGLRSGSNQNAGEQLVPVLSL